MNYIDFIVLGASILISLAFLSVNFVVSTISTISLAVSIFFASLLLDRFIALLTGFGWSENVFTPLTAFPLLIIVIWGVMSSLLVVLLGDLVRRTGRYKRILSLAPNLLQIFLIFLTIMMVIPQLSGNQKIENDVQNSYIYRTFISNPVSRKFVDKYLSSIDSRMALSVVFPENNEDVYLLDFEATTVKQSLVDEQTIVNVTNEQRILAKSSKLIRDSRLDELSAKYGKEILANKRFSHIDASGGKVDQRANEMGISFSYIGENLALGPNVKIAFDELMKSESHRNNIESPVFKKMGVAVFDIPLRGKLIVQIFSN